MLYEKHLLLKKWPEAWKKSQLGQTQIKAYFQAAEEILALRKGAGPSLEKKLQEDHTAGQA